MTVRKSYGRFNLFDLILLLILLAILVAAFFYFIPQKNASAGMPADCVFTLSGVRSDLLGGLYAGDTLYDASGNVSLGKIQKIDAVPDTLKIAAPDNTDGETVNAAYPPNTILSVTLSVKLDHAVPVENGFSVGTLQILNGENVRIRTSGLSAVGVCRGVVFSGTEGAQ